MDNLIGSNTLSTQILQIGVIYPVDNTFVVKPVVTFSD